jgi:hypothetical protein
VGASEATLEQFESFLKDLLSSARNFLRVMAVFS